LDTLLDTLYHCIKRVFVKHLKREECATASAVHQAEMGCPPAKKREKYDVIHKK